MGDADRARLWELEAREPVVSLRILKNVPPTIVSHRVQLHRVRLTEHVTDPSPIAHSLREGAAAHLISQGFSAFAADRCALRLLSGLVNRHATMLAYDDASIVLGLLFVVTIPLVPLLPARRKAMAPATAAAKAD